MKTAGMAALAAVAALATASTSGLAQCTVTSAPAESLSINHPQSGPVTWYAEERELCTWDGGLWTERHPGCGYEEEPPTSPPPVGWGFLHGQGTWIYQEANGIPGLQAGWDGVCTPAYCCGGVGVGPYCVILVDFLWDENCGAGPDLHIF